MDVPYCFLTDTDGNRYFTARYDSYSPASNPRGAPYLPNGTYLVQRDTVADLLFFSAGRMLYAMASDITFQNGVRVIAGNIQNGVDGSVDVEVNDNGTVIYQNTVKIKEVYSDGYNSNAGGCGLGFHFFSEPSLASSAHSYFPYGVQLNHYTRSFLMALDGVIVYSSVSDIAVGDSLEEAMTEILRLNDRSYASAVYDISSVPGKGYKLKTWLIDVEENTLRAGYMLPLGYWRSSNIVSSYKWDGYGDYSGNPRPMFAINTSTAAAREDTQYYVIQQSVSEGGNIQIPSLALPGDTVTLTITPSSRYTLQTLSITSGGEMLPYTSIGSGVYTFVMPDSAVTVSATFQRIPLQAIADYGSFLKGFAVGQVLRVNPRGVSGDTTIPARPDSSAQYDRDSFLLGLAFGRTFAGKIL